MLNLTIFTPLVTGLLLLLLPGTRPVLIRRAALAGAALTFFFSVSLLGGYDAGNAALQWRTTVPWIPSIGANYDVAVDGLSLPLIVLTGFLMLLVMVYSLNQMESAKGHAFLFLLMETGLVGLFAAQDLLLFYLFFEIGLVPMYFIVGIFGGERRRYAAMKFFLYTRAGSLAMLLSFLALYLSMEPRTFSLPAIVQAQPLAGSALVSAFTLLGLVLGFGVKLPIVPLHNWLPDAHVEAPTEGSVVLAGIQLKMGGYGILRVMLPCLPDAVREYAWILIGIALLSLVYGSLAALAQTDLKRLVAYTSVNHMAYVLLAAAVWSLSTDPGVRRLAVSGAVFQLVSHGLLTGGMFFLIGILQHRAGTRDMARFGGLLGRVPVFSSLLAVLAFGSLGLPGLSGFVAEFQVIGATLSVSWLAALITVLGLIVTTGLYLRVIVEVLMGQLPGEMRSLQEPEWRELGTVASLALFSFLLGILPGPLQRIIDGTSRLMGVWNG